MTADFMKTKVREYKSLPQATKAIQDRTVTTLFSVAGTVDSYGDKMWPGAFTQSFAQRKDKILHLWQHNFEAPPIAVIKSLREVGRDELPPELLNAHPEAMGGAEAVSEFLETERANEVLVALKAGSPLQASFGFDAIRFDMETVGEQKIRNLRDVRLWEVSTVLWGAEGNTLGSKALLPLDFLLDQIELQIKAGARHSAADVKALNAIHKAAVELGAANCKGVIDDEEPTKSRADQPSLTLLSERLRLLQLTAY